jgi:hypothetical protein
MPSVSWGGVELEPEVADWVRRLPDDEFGRVEFGQAVRIAYYIASGRRILLTVFSKQRRRERVGIARAVRAMKRCLAEGHTAEEDSRD